MRRLLLITSILSVSACDLSPDFTLPEMLTPETYKEAPTTAEDTDANAGPVLDPADNVKWKRVDEKAKIEEVAWWRMFNQPELDSLMEEAMKDSPTLEVAAQRVAQARGTAEISGASLLPSISAGFGPERQKQSGDSINASFPSPTPAVTKPYTLYTARGSITYELDLFGKNRNTTRAAERDADAEENNYRAARLALQADIAQAYFEHASLVAERDILMKAMETRTTTRDQIKSKFNVGLVDDLTLANAEIELNTAQSDFAAVTQQLKANEHRIAVLIGSNPSQIRLGNSKLTSPPPVVPAGIPSELLARRPDVQAAAQQMAAANARIGAAKAGYLPDISLSASGGYSAADLGDLFRKGNEFWLLGPIAGSTILTQPIFEGGRLSGTLHQRKAVYEGAVASYKNAVLNAFREVEDNLSAVTQLNEQHKSRRAAVASGTRAFNVATERYDIGYSSQLEYLDAQRGLLAAERGEVQTLGQRYIATVQLIRALGGSWVTASPAKTVTDKVVVPSETAPDVKTEKPEASIVIEPKDVVDEKPVDTAPAALESKTPDAEPEAVPAAPWYDFWS